MTTSDIIRIVSTVAVSQLLCDWLANKLFFSKEPYQRSLGNLERAQWKLRRAQEEAATAKGGAEKHEKKLQRAEEESKETAADVAQKHTVPQVFISIFFLMLLRIFGTEYTGRPIAILPFMPVALLRKVTGRGLDLSLATTATTGPMENPIPQLAAIAASSGNKVTDVSQACSFLLIYILASFSVKYYVHKLFGTEPPKGADQGIGTIMESPQVTRMARSLGLDPDQILEGKPKATTPAVEQKPKQTATGKKTKKIK